MKLKEVEKKFWLDFRSLKFNEQLRILLWFITKKYKIEIMIKEWYFSKNSLSDSIYIASISFKNGG